MGLDMYAVRMFEQKKSGRDPAGVLRSRLTATESETASSTQSSPTESLGRDEMSWRKANHIHAWFVDNVQNGNDDCKPYLVSWEKLRELYSICKKVLEASKLIDGMVYAGTVYDKKHPGGVVKREPGKVIEDATVAKKLLPRREGFFFGNQEYDEDYLKDVEDTFDWLTEALADYATKVRFMISYQSSW